MLISALSSIDTKSCPILGHLKGKSCSSNRKLPRANLYLLSVGYAGVTNIFFTTLYFDKWDKSL
jgi:hypothetical protein